ncbi:hypothetical protein [Burkholderia ubonensis]|uniref:hypothetical protein n=1 Tax=Burkholderia ubonensis TaxID=101571 RepID=UPI0012FBE84D|nr:hypothetical protein [Burkholderia ubonensis]
MKVIWREVFVVRRWCVRSGGRNLLQLVKIRVPQDVRHLVLRRLKWQASDLGVDFRSPQDAGRGTEKDSHGDTLYWRPLAHYAAD